MNCLVYIQELYSWSIRQKVTYLECRKNGTKLYAQTIDCSPISYPCHYGVLPTITDLRAWCWNQWTSLDVVILVSRRVSLKFSFIAAVILLKKQDHKSRQNPFVTLILGLTIDWFSKSAEPDPILQLKWMFQTNEIVRELSLNYVSDGYFIPQ